MIDLDKMMAALPDRMRRLPRDHRGFPVPWFVAWLRDGKPVNDGYGEPDFRVIGPGKVVDAVKQRRCWVCGDKLGVHLAFVIGPMCAINRVISEPPSHRECATFSARFCPFLSQPRMKRNEKDLPADGKQAAGLGLKRNPGLACVWVTKNYQVIRAAAGTPGVLFSLGPPQAVEWWAQGRPATRAEVDQSIASGLPSLIELAEQEKGGVAALNSMVARAQSLLPAPGP